MPRALTEPFQTTNSAFITANGSSGKIPCHFTSAKGAEASTKTMKMMASKSGTSNGTDGASAMAPSAFNITTVVTGSDWDPTAPKNVAAVSEYVGGNGTAPFLLRIKRDMMAIYHDPPPGILVMQDEQDMTVIHALITGSFDTPYEGGFFYFIVRCPPDYPIIPPHVKFMTTHGGTVRFNPNLYKCGKVCISILGTWAGPAWTPALTLSSVLISIQSLLTENPYHNEPGFEMEKNIGDSRRYNDIIQHETIRVAVIGMVSNETQLYIPEPLQDAMKQSFLSLYDFYESVVVSKLPFTGCAMQDPFGEDRGTFQYEALLVKLRALKTKLSASPALEIPSTLSSDDSSSSVSPATPPGK